MNPFSKEFRRAFAVCAALVWVFLVGYVFAVTEALRTQSEAVRTVADICFALMVSAMLYSFMLTIKESRRIRRQSRTGS